MKWLSGSRTLVSHLVLQPGTNIDCPLAGNLEDIVRDFYIYW